MKDSIKNRKRAPNGTHIEQASVSLTTTKGKQKGLIKSQKIGAKISADEDDISDNEIVINDAGIDDNDLDSSDEEYNSDDVEPSDTSESDLASSDNDNESDNSSNEDDDDKDESDSVNTDSNDVNTDNDKGGDSYLQQGESSSGTPAGTISLNLPDEYDYDSSDEEDIRNTVGNIPMEWYKEFEHIGYDLLGKKLMKGISGDKLDEFLDKNENPDYWRTVKDKMTGEQRVLTDEEVNIIQNFLKKKYVDPSYDPYEPWVDFFTHETMIHPVTNRPEHKRSFIPSLWEKKKVGQLVHAIKMGWIKPDAEKKEEEEGPKFYDIWKDEEQKDVNKRFRHHIPAPKRELPGHAESYAPPPEYLLTPEEEAKWNEQDPEERRMNFIPRAYSSLRLVPAYPRFVNEQFERCLDLYLCARKRKMRMNVNVEDLIPKLPKPKDLQPFPTTEFLQYKGHTGAVRCISIDSSGRWLASGSEDHTVKVWDVMSGRCYQTYQFSEPIKDVAWNPNSSLCMLAVACGKKLMIIVPRFDDKMSVSSTDKLINSFNSDAEEVKEKLPISWEKVEDANELSLGVRLRISHPETIDQVVWRSQGDYLATVMKLGKSMSVVIHHLSKRKSQNPFKKPKGQVQSVLFHPTRPLFYVATMTCVRVYNLLKQELVKKLMSNCQWVSSMAIHPKGDNVIIGSYDKKLSWFDTELSNKPYQTVRHHKKAIRQVCYHKCYPLFASASDDGTVLVSHGKVFDDLLQNPLIVPVKILKGHSIVNDIGVLDCEFHPTQPYLFSAGADCTIRLFCNV